MKKFLLTLFLILTMYLPVSALEYVPTECDYMQGFLKNLKLRISRNVEYTGKSAHALVSFKMSPAGKISNIKILKSDNLSYNQALLWSLHSIELRKKDMQGYIFDRDVYFVGEFSSDSVKVARMSNYSKKLGIEGDKIVKDLFEWNYFVTKPLIVYVEIQSDGTIKDTKLIQSSGVKEFDKAVNFESKKQRFTSVDPNAPKEYNHTIVVTKPLDDKLSGLYKNYLLQMGTLLSKSAPADNTTAEVVLRMTVDKTGAIKEAKLIESIDNPVFRDNLSSAYKELVLPAFPKEVDLGSFTFIYILNPVDKTWKIQTFPEFIYF